MEKKINRASNMIIKRILIRLSLVKGPHPSKCQYHFTRFHVMFFLRMYSRFARISIKAKYASHRSTLAT